MFKSQNLWYSFVIYDMISYWMLHFFQKLSFTLFSTLVKIKVLLLFLKRNKKFSQYNNFDMTDNFLALYIIVALCAEKIETWKYSVLYASIMKHKKNKELIEYDITVELSCNTTPNTFAHKCFSVPLTQLILSLGCRIYIYFSTPEDIVFRSEISSTRYDKIPIEILIIKLSGKDFYSILH